MGTELLTITIGRNIGSEPMPESDWTEFLVQIAALGETIGLKTGQSQWGDTVEESASVELWAMADDLRDILPILRDEYHQDGIGLWRGEVI